MTDEKDMRLNAAIAELISQRDMAQARCANLAGDLAASRARVVELEKPEKPKLEAVTNE